MNVFLSASVPDPRRDPRYFDTADMVAIREAVRGLATVIARRADAQLVWGGHPAITPLVREVVHAMGASLRERVRLYQSEFFRREFPPENAEFETVVVTPAAGDRARSLALMRREMLGPHQRFEAGVFIGGMEGVEDEWAAFAARHPQARLLPVATTGAAARILFERHRERIPAETARLLATEYAYMSLFRRTLPPPPGDAAAPAEG
jgi:hypothetical protein